jgi:predicted nucleic acid-binding protein
VARLESVGGTLILDAEGLMQFSLASRTAMSFVRDVQGRGGKVVTAGSTLAEVLRGGARDSAVHRVLGSVRVIPVDQECGRKAGELLGRTGLSGHRHALDALLAVVALGQPRPAVLLTSDPDDMAVLTEEPERPKAERIAVVRA